MSNEKVTYKDAYQSLRNTRRIEVGRLHRQMSDSNPVPRFLLGFFFFFLGAVIVGMLPPIGAIISFVGLLCLGNALKLWWVHRHAKRELSDEEFRWNLRDRALKKLTDKNFETLGKAVEAQGSYDSVNEWMGRKELSEDERNALILTAAACIEQRNRMLAGSQIPGGDAAQTRITSGNRAQAQHDQAFEKDHEDQGAGQPASQEGLHQKLLDAEADSDQSPAAPALSTREMQDRILKARQKRLSQE